MAVMGLLRASLNVSGLRTMDFDQTFGKKFRSQVSKVYGGLADHVNSWWGVELLIPLLKHTK